MRSRWDYLYDRQPVAITDYFIDEAAQWLAKNLREWPLPIGEWAYASEKERFQPLLEAGTPRPDSQMYGAAFSLARWEMRREWEAIDDYMRNERWREITTPGLGVNTIILLYRYLVEQTLAIAEITEGRIGKTRLVELLDKTERAI